MHKQMGNKSNLINMHSLFLLGFAGFLWKNESVMAISASNVLQLRVTARDFMSSGCMRPNEIDQFWYGTSTAHDLNARWINIPSRCPISQDILDGKYSGHPDFEAFAPLSGAG
jgi:hypothetical protein